MASMTRADPWIETISVVICHFQYIICTTWKQRTKLVNVHMTTVNILRLGRVKGQVNLEPLLARLGRKMSEKGVDNEI